MKIPLSPVILSLLLSAIGFGMTGGFEGLPGAMSAAMAGSGFATPGHPESLSLNPAAMAGVPGTRLSFNLSPFLESVHGSAYGAHGFQNGITVAARFQGSHYGSITGDVRFNGDPGRILTPHSIFGSAGVGIPLLPGTAGNFRLNWGLQGTWFMQALDGQEASDGSLGTGLLMAYAWQGRHGLSLGAGVRDMAFSHWSEGPRNFYLAAGYSLTLPALSVLLSVDAFGTEGILHGAAGLDVGILGVLRLRAGYRVGPSTGNLSFGGGATFRLGGFTPEIEYACIPMGDLGDRHLIQLSFSFGSPAAIAPRSPPRKPEGSAVTNRTPG